MNNPDLSGQVMKKVVSFEKKRSGYWLFRFGVITFFLLGVIFLVGKLIWNLLAEAQSFDLLNFINEDKEIIKDFGWDNLMIFMEELPLSLTVAAILLITLAVVFFLLTRKTLTKTTKRLDQVLKYKKK